MCDVLSTCSLGVVFGFLSNQKFSDSIGGFENTASSALQDGVNYLNDTLNVREKERREKGKEGGREGEREGGKRRVRDRENKFFFFILQQVTFIATDQFNVAANRIVNDIQSTYVYDVQ